MILLACDIGNNYLKLGFYKKNELFNYFRTPTEDFSVHFLKDHEFDDVAFSSVVPESSKTLSEFIQKNFGLSPLIISSSTKFNLEIDYDTPNTLGIDRICGVEGAFAIYCSKNDRKKLKKSEAIITVDLGTATTVNIVEYPRNFTGGAILPGIKMMSNTLNESTAQLPIVDMKDYEGVVGKSTNSSIVSGIINATVGGIEKIVNTFKKEKNIKVVHTFLTGGNAAYIKKRLDIKNSFVEDLVLRGVKAVYERNR